MVLTEAQAAQYMRDTREMPGGGVSRGRKTKSPFIRR